MKHFNYSTYSVKCDVLELMCMLMKLAGFTLSTFK